MEQMIRRALLAALSMAWLVAAPLWPAPARADEAAVRAATQALVEAWNRHDVEAWSDHLAEDAWVTDINDSLYVLHKGREAAIGRFSASIRTNDLQWRIVRMKARPDGIVSVVMVEELSVLPKTGGKYKAVYTSDPSFARWRREADGRWRLVFFTSHKGWAMAEIKKDDEGVVTAAAPAPSSASATAASAAPRPAALRRQRARRVHRLPWPPGARLQLLPRPAADTAEL